LKFSAIPYLKEPRTVFVDFESGSPNRHLEKVAIEALEVGRSFENPDVDKMALQISIQSVASVVTLFPPAAKFIGSFNIHGLSGGSINGS
jgi:hypothetical protein